MALHSGSSISRDGQQFLFTVPPKPRGSRYPRQITVFDRQGKVVRTLGELGEPGNNYRQPMLSPDGTQVPAYLNGDIHVFDVSSGKSAQVTSSSFPGDSPSLVWSPDGSQLAFSSYRQNGENGDGVYRIASNGTGSEELLYRHTKFTHLLLTDWSPDGRFLSFSAGEVPWALPVNGERKAVELMREEFDIYALRFSPDGRYVAYVSEESGRKEVYVRPFDSSRLALGAAKWQVSKDGGLGGGALGLVQWRRDGRELYYVAADGGVMAVEVTTTPAFQAGTPQLLFRAPATFLLTSISGEAEGNNFVYCSNVGRGCEQGSISRSGQRFVFAVEVPPARQEVAVAPEILAKYTGTYLQGNWDWTVTLEGNRLMIQRDALEKARPAPLFAESETKFFLKATNGDFEFVKDDKGDVKYLFMYRGGAPTQAIRR